MRWLALAVLLGGADAVISGFIDSIGRPDVNARFSLAELALYGPLLVVLLRVAGIEGAAVACVLRVGLDLAARAFIAGRLVPRLRPILARVLLVAFAATAAIALPLLVASPFARLAAMVVATLVFAAALWGRGLERDERAALIGRLRRLA